MFHHKSCGHCENSNYIYSVLSIRSTYLMNTLHTPQPLSTDYERALIAKGEEETQLSGENDTPRLTKQPVLPFDWFITSRHVYASVYHCQQAGPQKCRKINLKKQKVPDEPAMMGGEAIYLLPMPDGRCLL